MCKNDDKICLNRLANDKSSFRTLQDFRVEYEIQFQKIAKTQKREVTQKNTLNNSSLEN